MAVSELLDLSPWSLAVLQRLRKCLCGRHLLVPELPLQLQEELVCPSLSNSWLSDTPLPAFSSLGYTNPFAFPHGSHSPSPSWPSFPRERFLFI